MDVLAKATMARALDALGVDIIEAGLPHRVAADAEAVQRIAQCLPSSALARCRPRDIEEAAQALAPRRVAHPHTFLALTCTTAAA